VVGAEIGRTQSTTKLHQSSGIPLQRIFKHNKPNCLLSMTTLSDFKETVRQQADIVRVIGDYIQLKKAGAKNFNGLCPFHNEKSPSFSVNIERQIRRRFQVCPGARTDQLSGGGAAGGGEDGHSTAEDALQI
jgi:hypothetical protein